MTDTITPASLRAHADHMERVHLDGISAEEMRQEAARLEAESARGEEAEKLAKAMWAAHPTGRAWEWLSEDAREGKVACARAGLDFLAAGGRLLLEGGTVLTADEADDVRTFMRWAAGRNNGMKHPDEAAYRIRVKFGLYDSRVPAPPAVSVPDSGPDGTPEKPWRTWQDVPEGVVYRGARDTSGWDGWFNRSGTRRRFFDGALSKNSEAMIADEAPFVRVDGDKA